MITCHDMCSIYKMSINGSNYRMMNNSYGKERFLIHQPNQQINQSHMSENYGWNKSRHIDIIYHFIREYVYQGIVKIVFVKS